MFKKLRNIACIIWGVLCFSWLAYNLIKLFFSIQIDFVPRPLWEYLLLFAIIGSVAVLIGWIVEKLDPIYEREKQKRIDRSLAKRSTAEAAADMQRVQKAFEEFKNKEL